MIGFQIVLPKNLKDANFHQFVIKIQNRNALIKYLQKFGIETAIHYPKIIPDQPFLKKEYGKIDLPVARKFVQECLSLPINPNMTLKKIDYISSKIVQFLHDSRY